MLSVIGTSLIPLAPRSGLRSLLCQVRTNISLPQAAHWLLLATLPLLQHPSSTAAARPLLFDCVAALQAYAPSSSFSLSSSDVVAAAAEAHRHHGARLLRLTPVYLAALGDAVRRGNAHDCNVV